MKNIRPLSPCVESAVDALSDNVTAWEFAKHLFEMHPEYTHRKIGPYIPEIDSTYKAEKKPIHYWLQQIAEHYPKEDLLHTKLVLLGLYKVDHELHQRLPKEVMTTLEKEIRFKQ